MKLPKFRIEVSYQATLCCRIPKYYGVAYQQFDRCSVVMYLIPFNLVAKFLRASWYFMKHGEFWPPKRRLLSTRIEALERETREQQEHIQKLHQCVSAEEFRKKMVAIGLAEMGKN